MATSLKVQRGRNMSHECTILVVSFAFFGNRYVGTSGSHNPVGNFALNAHVEAI